MQEFLWERQLPMNKSSREKNEAGEIIEEVRSKTWALLFDLFKLYLLNVQFKKYNNY